MRLETYLNEGYTPEQMKKVMWQFKEKHPEHMEAGLNITDMDMILKGLKQPPKPATKPDVKPKKVKDKWATDDYFQKKNAKADLQASNLQKWINKAEQFVGDMAYELAQTKVKDHNDHEAVMRKVEMMSKKDLDMCRSEALYQVNCPPELLDAALKLWKKRGY